MLYKYRNCHSDLHQNRKKFTVNISSSRRGFEVYERVRFAHGIAYELEKDKKCALIAFQNYRDVEEDRYISCNKDTNVTDLGKDNKASQSV